MLLRRCHTTFHRAMLPTSRRVTTLVNAHQIGPVAETRGPTVKPTLMNHVSIFEDRTSEYPIIQPSPITGEASTSSLPGSTDQSGIVARLVLQEDFLGALAAKRELSLVGVSIEPDAIFLRAARDALQHLYDEVRRKTFIRVKQDTNVDLAEDMQSSCLSTSDESISWADIFLDWWALVPTSTAMEALPPICEVIVKDRIADLNFAQRFCIACAERGMAAHVGVNIFPEIIRHAHPKDTSQFLDAFENAARRNRDGTIVNGRSHRWSHWRNVAIIIHFNAGRREMGMKMYEEALRQKKHIEDATSEVVRRNVSRNGVSPKLKTATPSFTLTRYGLLDRSKLPSPSQMALELRALRSLILNHTPRTRFDSRLADFMYIYRCAYKRERALRIFRKRVFEGKNKSLADSWVSAELLFYSSRKRPLAVLRTFAHYFQPGFGDGVIFDLVKGMLKESESWGTNKRDRFDWPTSSELLYPVRQIISPTQKNISMAWKALLTLTFSPQRLERFYELFLSTLPSAPKSHTPTNPTTVVFHHFVHAFSNRVGPQRGSGIVSDMQRLGYVSSVGTWAVLAGAYARLGEIDKVEKLLSHIESKRMFQTVTTEKAVPSPSAPTRYSFVRRWKVKAIYNNIARGYLKNGFTQEARKVINRMQEKGLFQGGVDVRTRTIVKTLTKMERGKIRVKPRPGARSRLDASSGPT